MVTRITRAVYDDLTGEPGAEPPKFSLDDQEYEIDLVNDDALRQALAPFIEAARSTTPPPPQVRRPGKPGKNAAVRAWALEQGLPLPPRGQVPRAIRAAYDASHSQLA